MQVLLVVFMSTMEFMSVQLILIRLMKKQEGQGHGLVTRLKQKRLVHLELALAARASIKVEGGEENQPSLFNSNQRDRR